MKCPKCYADLLGCNGRSFCQFCGDPEKEKAEASAIEIELQVEKLNIKSGDILVVKGSKLNAQNFQNTEQNITDFLKHQGIHDVRLMFIQDGTTIEALDEESMERSGWMPAKKLANLNTVIVALKELSALCERAWGSAIIGKHTRNNAILALKQVEEEQIKFELHRYNPLRAARGVVAAEVKVIHPEGGVQYLWMSQEEIKLNIKEFGESDGLLECLNAYKKNIKV